MGKDLNGKELGKGIMQLPNGLKMQIPARN